MEAWLDSLPGVVWSLLSEPGVLDEELVPGVPERALGDDAVLLLGALSPGIELLPGGELEGCCWPGGGVRDERDEPEGVEGDDDLDELDELEELEEPEELELEELDELDELDAVGLCCGVCGDELVLGDMLMQPERTSIAPASRPGISGVIFITVPPRGGVTGAALERVRRRRAMPLDAFR